MFALVALAVAGGVCGGGVKIPVLLIFFDMTMHQAVPISSLVSLCTSCLRFIMNYDKMHPQYPARNYINYDLVQLTMPCVFLGSFIGVFIG